MNPKKIDQIWFSAVFIFVVQTTAASALFPLLFRQILWLMGIFFFLFFSSRHHTGPGVELMRGKAAPGDVSFGGWVLLLSAGILFRAARFWGTTAWPNFDECQIVQTGIQLSRHWEWKPFYSLGQIPALMNWLEGLLFMVSDHVFLNAWLLPIFISVATMILAFLAFRKLFNPSLLFPSVLFFAVSFWPSFTGSFCVQQVLLPFWECAALFFTACYREAVKPSGRIGWAAGLGFWVGLGFWTYLAWPVVAFVFILIVLGMDYPRRENPRKRTDRIIFGAVFAGAFLPYACAFWRARGFQHSMGFSVLSDWFPVQQRAEVVLDYVNGIFWGFGSGKTLYAPLEGGLLNPFLATLCWVGIAEFWNQSSFRRRFWGLAIFVLFFLPGCLTQNLQFLRIGQLLPVVALAVAMGFRALAVTCSNRKLGLAILFILFAVFGAWDLFRLLEYYHLDEGRAVSFRAAYKFLDSVQKDEGPGLIFTEFGVPDSENQELEAAVYPFNAAQNPRVGRDGFHWMAAVTNADYRPFLQRRFPAAQWGRLPDGEFSHRGKWLLGLLPYSTLGPSGEKAMEEWALADRWFHRLSQEINDVNNAKSYEKVKDVIENPPRFVLSDRFLAASYYERLSDFYYGYGFQKNYDLQVNALKQSLEKGYPAAHLYYQLGVLLMRRHHYAEAREALRKASLAPAGEIPVGAALGLLDRLESKNRKENMAPIDP